MCCCLLLFLFVFVSSVYYKQENETRITKQVMELLGGSAKQCVLFLFIEPLRAFCRAGLVRLGCLLVCVAGLSVCFVAFEFINIIAARQPHVDEPDLLHSGFVD